MENTKWEAIRSAATMNGFSLRVIKAFDGTILKVLDNNTFEELLSIANHSFSYGHEQGLCETWSKWQRENGEDPTGYLTEQQVIEQIQKLKGKQND